MMKTLHLTNTQPDIERASAILRDGGLVAMPTETVYGLAANALDGRAVRRIFEALDGFGLSRVDFFLEKDTNRVIFNEINTLPGFTSISMYPMLWAARGVKVEQLVEDLVQTAFVRRK